jgi:hypothetical protein
VRLAQSRELRRGVGAPIVQMKEVAMALRCATASSSVTPSGGGGGWDRGGTNVGQQLVDAGGRLFGASAVCGAGCAGAPGRACPSGGRPGIADAASAAPSGNAATNPWANRWTRSQDFEPWRRGCATGSLATGGSCLSCAGTARNTEQELGRCASG